MEFSHLAGKAMDGIDLTISYHEVSGRKTSAEIINEARLAIKGKKMIIMLLLTLIIYIKNFSAKWPFYLCTTRKVDIL